MIDLSQKIIFELLLKAFLLGVALGLLYDGVRFVKMLCGVEYDRKSLAAKGENGRVSVQNDSVEKTRAKTSAGVEKANGFHAKAVFLYAVTFIFDLVFWVVFGISAVLLFYNVSGGVFRASVLPAMLGGLFLYYISLGRLMLALSARLVILLRIICRFVLRIVSVPLSFAEKILFSLYHLTIGKILGRIKEERILRARKNKRKCGGEATLCERDGEGESEYGGKPYRSEGRISFGRR